MDIIEQMRLEAKIIGDDVNIRYDEKERLLSISGLDGWIPKGLTKCKSIQILIISGKNLDDIQFWNYLTQLPNLKKLTISNISKVHPAISKLPNLKELVIYDKQTNIIDLPENIGLSNLEILLIRTKDKIPAGIYLLKNLRELSIDHTGDLCNLSNSLSNLANLKYLRVNGNIQNIPEDIGFLSKLENIYLYKTQIQEIPLSVGKLEGLKSLSIKNAPISVIPDEITRCDSMNDITISETNLTSIPQDIGKMKNLLELSLPSNKLKKIHLENPKLHSLILRDNPITEIDLSRLKSLYRLDISQVHLTEINYSMLPNYIFSLFIDNLYNIKKIDLTNCLVHHLSCVYSRIADYKFLESMHYLGILNLKLPVLDKSNNSIHRLDGLVEYLRGKKIIIFDLECSWFDEDQQDKYMRIFDRDYNFWPNKKYKPLLDKFVLYVKEVIIEGHTDPNYLLDLYRNKVYNKVQI